MRAARPVLLSVFPIVVAMYVPLCTPNVRPTAWPEAAPLAELWMRPADLADQDLYAGPWGADHAPDPQAEYTGLSEQQWQDAFRAGGYDRDVAARFIAALRSRISQGQQLAGDDRPEP